MTPATHSEEPRLGGVDLGATYIRAAVGWSDGEMLTHVKTRTPQEESGDAVARALVEALGSAAADAGLTLTDLDAVGVGSLGPLDHETGTVVDPPNVRGVDRIPVVDALAAATDAPVSLYNDATAGALGEAVGSDRTYTDIVYVTISTGLGAGAVVDGHLLCGHRHNAGEMGHVVVDPHSPVECGCGGRGHWEAFAAGGNIPTFARHLADERGIDTDLALGDLTAERVFEAADGDPLAGAVVEELGRINALGTATVVHAYDPEVVAFGGGVAVNNPDAILRPIRERLPDLVVTDPPEVRETAVGDRVVVTGALAAAGGHGVDVPL